MSRKRLQDKYREDLQRLTTTDQIHKLVNDLLFDSRATKGTAIAVMEQVCNRLIVLDRRKRNSI